MWWKAAVSFLCVAVAGQVHLQSFPRDFTAYLDTGKRSATLEDTLQAIKFKENIREFRSPFHNELLQGKDDISKAEGTCSTCKTIVDTALGWVLDGQTRDQVLDNWVRLCVDLNVAREHVCRGNAESLVDTAMFIVKYSNITSEKVCGFALYPDCPLEGDEFEWSIDLTSTGTKPPLEEPVEPPPGSPKLKVLHLTDIHVDPNYTPGGNALCGDYMCCRNDQGPPANDSAAAGYWGDSRGCDMPLHAFRDMLQHVVSTHPDIDYVIFTGDIIDHGKWSTSTEYNSEWFRQINYEIRAAFNYKVMVFPIFGNHESHPSNVFSTTNLDIPENINSRWLYHLAADTWGSWIPEVTNQILSGGRYVGFVNTKFVVIALNNNFCYTQNWWLLYDNYDPMDQLAWLAQQLSFLESQGRKVHILAHIPPGTNTCWDIWSREYRRILHRFENTVVAQFHGHTHRDQFHVYYDLEDSTRPTMLSFTGGSATAFRDVNPNYRIYTVEGEYEGSSYRVLDHETWSYNLTEANLGGADVPPVWKKLYSFKEAYGVSTMLPKDVDELVHKMAANSTLMEIYYRYYVKEGDSSLAKGCDDACKRRLLCGIVTTVTGDNSKCDELSNISQ